MALDEYLYGKISGYFKKNKKVSADVLSKTVLLEDIKPRLAILSRAATGKSIEIFPAEREGGYKRNNFFLPASMSIFPTFQQNLTFYFFRILYLSTQKNLGLNWDGKEELSIEEARLKARQSSTHVLENLFKEFPVTQ
ncbi:MAG: hypothetical protein ACRC2O_03800, partial [Chitinophagaceae bacterium]